MYQVVQNHEIGQEPLREIRIVSLSQRLHLQATSHIRSPV